MTGMGRGPASAHGWLGRQAPRTHPRRSFCFLPTSWFPSSRSKAKGTGFRPSSKLVDFGPSCLRWGTPWGPPDASFESSACPLTSKARSPGIQASFREGLWVCGSEMKGWIHQQAGPPFPWIPVRGGSGLDGAKSSGRDTSSQPPDPLGSIHVFPRPLWGTCNPLEQGRTILTVRVTCLFPWLRKTDHRGGGHTLSA